MLSVNRPTIRQDSKKKMNWSELIPRMIEDGRLVQVDMTESGKPVYRLASCGDCVPYIPPMDANEPEVVEPPPVPKRPVVRVPKLKVKHAGLESIMKKMSVKRKNCFKD